LATEKENTSEFGTVASQHSPFDPSSTKQKHFVE
jgi:hypothetical protein